MRCDPSPNDFAAIERDIVLILDDFLVIDRLEIHDALAYLINRLPSAAHLVITTRADPLLPLARLRVLGELVEIHAADLRFTPDEAAAYLNRTMGLKLTSADVAALEARTEGWIAALQLTARSIPGAADRRLVHRLLSRRQPLRLRLSRRRSARAPARGGSERSRGGYCPSATASARKESRRVPFATSQPANIPGLSVWNVTKTGHVAPGGISLHDSQFGSRRASSTMNGR